MDVRGRPPASERVRPQAPRIGSQQQLALPRAHDALPQQRARAGGVAAAQHAEAGCQEPLGPRVLDVRGRLLASAHVRLPAPCMCSQQQLALPRAHDALPQQRACAGDVAAAQHAEAGCQKPLRLRVLDVRGHLLASAHVRLPAPCMCSQQQLALPRAHDALPQQRACAGDVAAAQHAEGGCQEALGFSSLDVRGRMLASVHVRLPAPRMGSQQQLALPRAHHALPQQRACAGDVAAAQHAEAGCERAAGGITAGEAPPAPHGVSGAPGPAPES